MKETIIRNELSTPNLSWSKFKRKMDELAEAENERRSHSNNPSKLPSNIFVKEAARSFAIETAEAQSPGYFKVEVDKIFNDPSSDSFDSSKNIVVNLVAFASFKS